MGDCPSGSLLLSLDLQLNVDKVGYDGAEDLP
jgi:hypothetical protein